jgi:hypothetical protein
MCESQSTARHGSMLLFSSEVSSIHASKSLQPVSENGLISCFLSNTCVLVGNRDVCHPDDMSDCCVSTSWPTVMKNWRLQSSVKVMTPAF